MMRYLPILLPVALIVALTIVLMDERVQEGNGRGEALAVRHPVVYEVERPWRANLLVYEWGAHGGMWCIYVHPKDTARGGSLWCFEQPGQ